MSSKEVALITGANKGIGLAVAHQLGALGYGLWLGCRDAKRGESAVSELRDAGFDARLLVIDVADAKSVAAAPAALSTRRKLHGISRKMDGPNLPRQMRIMR